ncbi:TolC family protein [Edaphobacter albus]|uniref:TolC family protein n=1 Tax=Edaphobacter sp. 4G125 TaxID=2763071 RepID=UPI001644A6C0|nr:TolC family protein [Edaphobacter sp. 4G125]QNI38255.1 TolC family protein [Edaphobacter sp. 4G125]
MMCLNVGNVLRIGILFIAAVDTVGIPLVSQGQQADVIPTHISLTDAIQRAKVNEPVFAASVASQKTAAINSYLAKAALLPSVTYHNQVLFTQSNGQHSTGAPAGLQSGPVFIANNAVHEYTSQASIGETIGLKQISDAKVASANAALANAELEVARRGLVATVVSLYYQVADAETKRQILTEAVQEASTFTDLTQKREAAREIAHADVIKAQLQQLQRQRDLSDANVFAEKARLELAVLLFPDPRTLFSTDPPGTAAVLPTQDEVNRLASANNPEIRSALAGLKASNAAVTSARAAYLPDLALNFLYGIDAPQFAKRGAGPDYAKNLGYSIMGTVDIPVWDWFSTQKRVKQSEIQRDVAKVTLTAAQRRLIANIDEAYSEAAAAQNQLALLDQSVQTAAESLRLTKLRYTAGESTALEVVDAQNSYLTTETARAGGIVRYESALAALQLLTGTL